METLPDVVAETEEKKLPPGQGDGHDREELSEGADLLVEMVTAAGRAPDQVAWDLQLQHWRDELFVCLPLLLWMVMDVFRLRPPEWPFLLYFFLLWPALTLRVFWNPLRGRRGESVVETLQDLAYLWSTLLPTVIGTYLACLPFWWVGVQVLSALGADRDFQSFVSFLAVSTLLAPPVAGRLLAGSLVDRELEGRDSRKLPAWVLEDLAGEASGPEEGPWEHLREGLGSRLRTLFRSAIPWLVAAFPLFWREMGYGRLLPGGSRVEVLWIFVFFWIGGLHMTRGAFYAAMAEETRRQLLGRSTVPALPGPEGTRDDENRPSRGEEPQQSDAGALLVPEGTGSGSVPGKAQSPALGNPGQTWKDLRSPRELATMLSLASLGALAFGLVVNGSWLFGAPWQLSWGLASLLVALVLGVVVILRELPELEERHSGIGPVLGPTVVPSVLLVAASVLVRAGLGTHGIFPGLASIVVGVLLTEAAMRRWSRAAVALAAGERPDAGGLGSLPSPSRLLGEMEVSWRRAAVLGAGAWLLGYWVAQLCWRAGAFSSWHQFMQWRTVGMVVLPALVGGQFLLRSHLRALRAEGSPSALPAGSSPPGDRDLPGSCALLERGLRGDDP